MTVTGHNKRRSYEPKNAVRLVTNEGELMCMPNDDVEDDATVTVEGEVYSMAARTVLLSNCKAL